MRIVDIEKAKSRFAKLIDAVSLGEVIMSPKRASLLPCWYRSGRFVERLVQ